VLLAPVLVLAVAGCGGPQKDATYESASKLREAVIASGVDCPGDASKHAQKSTEDFIKCSAGMGLHTYGTDSDMKMGRAMDDFTKQPYLAGNLWVIEADAAALAKIKDKLGGSLVVP
jgi:hypothetical protein